MRPWEERGGPDPNGFIFKKSKCYHLKKLSLHTNTVETKVIKV
jgi:hypothetical protein